VSVFLPVGFPSVEYSAGLLPTDNVSFKN